MKLTWLFVLFLLFCFQLILTENASSVTAINWMTDEGVHYATGDEARGLIRECKFFIMLTIVLCFIYCCLSIFDFAFPYIKMLSNVEPCIQLL